MPDAKLDCAPCRSPMVAGGPLAASRDPLVACPGFSGWRGGLLGSGWARVGWWVGKPKK